MKTVDFIIMKIKRFLGFNIIGNDDPVYDGRDVTTIKTSKDSVIKNMDLSNLETPKILNEDGNKTLLVVNDIPTMLSLLEVDLEYIKTTYKYDIYKDYKIVICAGKYANLMAYKYLKTHKVDIALVDIILADNLLFLNNDIIEFNGLDVAEEIKKEHNSSKIAIFTSLPVLEITTGAVKGYIDHIQKLLENKVIEQYININTKKRTFNLATLLHTKNTPVITID